MTRQPDPVSGNAAAGNAVADILVVDLLGGIGDLLMILPAVHGLARLHPRATMRVVTHEPGADLVRGDPAVDEVITPAPGVPGGQRAAVVRALAACRPDLAVTTSRFEGIPDVLEAAATRAVTDLWRRPPPDELVGRRYLRILREEGLLGPQAEDAAPSVYVSDRERLGGERVLAAALGPDGEAPAGPPVVLVTASGMPVKEWPERHALRFVQLIRRAGLPVLAVTPVPGVAALPPMDLRRLAACFAAVARRGGAVVGGDTGPVRLAAAAGASTVSLYGPTLAGRYGIGGRAASTFQGLPDCAWRRPTAITEQVCWWHADCPLSPSEPACMADIPPQDVAARVLAAVGAPAGRTPSS